ncbi:hypothetical protein BV25DRAFT_1921102 [Artomyces pyxidatus]|uniref:Uncharacterized protein n=1 Tax=Artomyces pyxidatus TaxID=48021 RepID=A0ACB8SJL6_9AGAM|nr:hypothetical protein BV25DRAFT_1921102 [Artomyces pyxidatus]
MNSPPEPASPISSASTDSLPLDREELQPAEAQLAAIPSSSQSGTAAESTTTKIAGKRRLPISTGKASNNRDSKSRRREEAGPRKGVWDSKEGRQKEDLIDVQISDTLKRRIGDPFDEDMIKNAS